MGLQWGAMGLQWGDWGGWLWVSNGGLGGGGASIGGVGGSWSFQKGLGDPSPILTPKSFSCETPAPF